MVVTDTTNVDKPIAYKKFSEPGCENYTIEQILQKDSLFVETTPESKSIIFYRNNKPLYRWSKIQYNNQSRHHWSIAMHVFSIENISYYQNNGQWIVDITGLCIAKKDFTSFFTYNILEVPSKESITTIYVKTKSYYEEDEFFLVNLKSFMQYFFNRLIINWIEIGILFMCALFSMSLFVRIEELYHLFYLLFVLSFSAFNPASYDLPLILVPIEDIDPNYILNTYNIPYGIMTASFMLFFLFLFKKSLPGWYATLTYILVIFRILSLFYLKYFVDFFWEALMTFCTIWLHFFLMYTWYLMVAKQLIHY